MTEVYKAINAVMATMAKEGMAKDRKNAQQGYNFRGIDDVYNALCGVMAENGLCMLPFVQTMVREERQTKNGGLLNYTILTVDFKLVSAKDGSHDTVRTVGEAMDSADKSANKAQSAALKYAALQVFMIPTEGDNDADATTHEVVAVVTITDEQAATISAALKATGKDEPAWLAHYGYDRLTAIPREHYEGALKAANKAKPKAKAQTDYSLSEPKANPQESLDDEIPYS